MKKKNKIRSLPKTLYVGTNIPTAIVSRITSRLIYVNDSSLFVVSPSFSRHGVEAARDDWRAHTDELVEQKTISGKYRYASNSKASLGLFKPNVALINKCFISQSQDEFRASVQELLRRIAVVEKKAAESGSAPGTKSKTGRRSGEAKRLLEVLMLMWKNGLLLFPMSEIWNTDRLSRSVFMVAGPSLMGPIGLNLGNMQRAVRRGEGRAFVLFPATIGNLTELGDIDEQVLTALVPFVPPRGSRRVFSVCDQLLIEQRRIYGLLPSIPQSYRTIFSRIVSVRQDPEFVWATERGGYRLREWVASIAGYLKSFTNRVAIRSEVTSFNQLLDYVISDDSIPSRPVELCRRDFEPRKSMLQFLTDNTEAGQTHISTALRAARRYFEAVLKTDACDDDGEVKRGFSNPIDIDSIPRQQSSKGKTDRSVIPLRFMRLLKEIIEGPYVDGEPTFRWPKSLKTDYFTWIEPATNSRQRIWSPVRANFFLLRFSLPIRGLQTRLLDSGESDFEEYRPSQGGWKINEGRLQPWEGDKKRPLGLIRKIWDAEAGRWFNGIYITTNKTADRSEMFTNSGYEIPWENQEVIDLFCRMRDWQEKYNPCARPLSRSEIKSDRSIMVSEDLAQRIDKLCFLFRDAADVSYPQEPITPGRMGLFWSALICELERRLELGDEKNRDGSVIKLVVSRSKKGQPRAVIFDMHSLRVTGLTALISAGVPIHILSEFVAGHAIFLMTLYYFKPGAAKVTEVLDEATKRISQQDDWESFLSRNSPQLIHDLSVYNSAEGKKAADETQSALHSSIDEGVCPNGGSLCNIGGPVIGKGNLHGPVAGGNRNCPLCRFFVTGPKYLVGLMVKFTATEGIIREKCLRLKDVEAQRRELVTLSVSVGEPNRVMDDRILAADEAIENIWSEVDILSQTWSSQERLIKRTKKIVDEYVLQDGKGKDALVLNGELSEFEISIREGSEFELWDRICHSADVFPSVDPSMPSIRRARLLDGMLARNKRTPVFATLTDQQLQHVGNAWTAHFRALIGEANLTGLIEGQVSLKELGVEAEMDALLASTIEEPRKISLLPARLASNSKG